MSKADSIHVSGMAVLTPLADEPEALLQALLAGRSAVTRWRSVDTSIGYSRIGADLEGYSVEKRAEKLAPLLPFPLGERLMRLLKRVPWSLQLNLLNTAAALIDAGLSAGEAEECHVVLGGHNLSSVFGETGFRRYTDGNMDVSHELYSLDTTHAACISELLGSHWATYTVGGACASGNVALLAAMREIRLRGARRVVVVGAVPEPSTLGIHAFALLGALSVESFNERPESASRPWDQRREGFVPAQSGGVMVLETTEAKKGRRSHAELCGVAVCSDASHLTVPDEEGQARVMALALRRARVAPEEVDYISAHATSTPIGDVVELRAIRRAFGNHAEKLKVNATKSMLGHCFNAAAIVEGIVGILQARSGMLHQSRNIDALDPAVDLEVCASGPVAWPVRCFLNNAFGFGGINTASIFRVEAA